MPKMEMTPAMQKMRHAYLWGAEEKGNKRQMDHELSELEDAERTLGKLVKAQRTIQEEEEQSKEGIQLHRFMFQSTWSLA